MAERVRIVNVANRLPITVGKEIKPSSGGLVSALAGVSDWADTLWIGWPGAPVQSKARRRRLDKYASQHGLQPVLLNRKQADGYYRGFANSSVWPILHYLPEFMRYQEPWWRDYREVNELFAETVAAAAKDSDLVLIHDYHLMLLPAMLRARRPELRIGFFLHTPFPSYEVFRCQPKRVELLEGLLGADLVGFHTFGYMRHFRSSLLRLLGLESEVDLTRHDGRRTYAGVYPIGVDAGHFVRELGGEAFAARRAQLAEAYRGKRLVLSIERLDYTKGIPQRLRAIDLYLRSCSDADKAAAIFLCVSVPSREDVPEYRKLRSQVERMVGEINGRHGTAENTPVRFLYTSVDFTELCALYSLADVALVTPLRDGMNLVAKEYLASRADGEGALVLSEFAGAAEELVSALRVNPYDPEDQAAKLRAALAMESEQRRARLLPMRSRVLQFDAQWWARSLVRDLRNREVEPSAAAANGGGSPFEIVPARFAEAKRRACFLDYDGTLREFETDPSRTAPSAETLELLTRLAAMDGVELYILSGRRSDDLDRWFGQLGIGLIAEHGFFRRRPGGQWEPVSESADLSWKQRVLEIFRMHEGTTPGSRTEEKQSAVVWHFRGADPEFGQWKAQQLISELNEVASNLPVEIHLGNKIVEVSSNQVNKGAAVTRCLRDGEYDLVFCAGDDQTDESMFRLQRPELLSVKVGAGSTAAQLRVADPAAMRRLLRAVLEDK